MSRRIHLLPSFVTRGFPNPDAEPIDAEPPAPDVGPPDMGIEPDAGFVDSGLDSGLPDAEPDAGVDGGFEDTGVADVGVDTTCNPNFFPAGACGGSLAGTQWRFVDACGDSLPLQQFLMSCPGSTNISISRTATGTLAFSLNDTYTLDVTDMQMVSLDVDPVCVVGLGGCVGFQSFLNTNGIPATCSSVGAACNCSIDFSVRQIESGDYNVTGTQVAVQAMGGGLRRYDFCVRQGTLRIKDTADPTTFVLTP